VVQTLKQHKEVAMKTILLTVFLVGLFAVSAYAQGNNFAVGAWLGMEANKRAMENRLAEQQLAIMQQQLAAMQQSRTEFQSEIFRQGYQEGYTSGYQRGTADTVDYVKQKEGEVQIMVFNFVGKELFSETSVENLTQARKGFLEALNTPNHYVAKVYLTLVDARLKELAEGKK